MDEPHIRRRPGREEGMLSLLADASQGVRDIPTRGEGLRGARAGERHRGEEGRGVAEVEGGETEREREADAAEGEAEEGGGELRGASATEGDRQLPGRERESGEGRESQRQLLRVLRDLSADLAERVSAWREALRGAACGLSHCQTHDGASLEQTCLTGPTFISDKKGESIQGRCCPDILHSALVSAVDDMRSIDALLSHIWTTLDGTTSTLCGSDATATADAKTDFQTTPLTQVTSPSQSCPGSHENTPSASESHDAPGLETGQPHLNVSLCNDGGEVVHADYASSSQDSASQSVSDLNSSRPQAGLRGEGEAELQEHDEQTSTGAERRAKIEDGVVSAVQLETDILKDIPPETDKQRERQAEREKERLGEGTRVRGGESKLVTMGLAGRSTNGQADVPNACYITAPVGVAEVLTCEVVEALSSLMVIGSEELVSRVIRVKVQDKSQCRFPITVAVPFRACYRGNYRDVVVKVIDGDRRRSYISPISTEGTFGGQRGSFAQVRVYALGLFAVLSCLKRESYTVPGRGLSIKLSMDPRVCLDYLPGSFTAPVVVQSMIQPVDAALLSGLKSKSDVYHPVVSTTPLLHLAHPTSQPLRRPLSLTLPCPPNVDKRREAGRGEEPDRPISVASPRDKPGLRSVRALSASAHCSRESSNELLVLLGWREEQWNVLEKTAVRSLQNGLVSFELTENYERLMVTRLLSSVRFSHLLSLVEDVEASVQRTMVTVVLQRHRDDPQAAVVAVFPSRDLGWELSKLRAQAYCGPPEPSQETPMCEGEQLLLSFKGNITSTEHLHNQNGSACLLITFHSQRKNRLYLRLTEVDPFGNYSSPHYKGTAVFHKVARGRLEQRGDEAAPPGSRPLDDPVCKLALTLPKKVRTICRPVSAKLKLCDETESLSDAVLGWLSRELSEEDLALLVLSLCLRRSSIQMVRLQAPDSLPAQALHILGLWRRSLPAAPHPSKSSQLAHSLAKCGRPDLAKELLLRQAATRGSSNRALGEPM